VLVDRFGLPQSCPSLNINRLWAPMRRDKKALADRLRWVLPSAIGSAFVHDDVPESSVQRVLELLVRG
jgi:3-dehydroquinate synthase